MKRAFSVLILTLLLTSMLAGAANIAHASSVSFNGYTDKPQYFPGETGTVYFWIYNGGPEAILLKNVTIYYPWGDNRTMADIDIVLARDGNYSNTDSFTIFNDSRAVGGSMIFHIFFDYGEQMGVISLNIVVPARALYIRADGSIDPTDAPISTVDNVTYTLTGNIASDANGIVVERDDIVIDGMGCTIQGPSSGTGMDLSGRRNVTLKNTGIAAFDYGIVAHYSSGNAIIKNNLTTCNRMGIDLYYSPNNSISGNSIANNLYGIWLEVSSNNTISRNTFTNDGLGVRWSYENLVENNTVNSKPLVYLENVSNYSVNNAGQVILTRCDNIRVEGLNLSETDLGVQLLETNDSIISGNNLANNIAGVHLHVSSNNTVSGNDISENLVGIWLYLSLNNRIHHNNFRDNTQQTYADVPTGDTLDNTWDDGYPSGGNYWSDYNGTDSNHDGIGDTSYIIDESNQDNYPLMMAWPEKPKGPGDVNGDGVVDIYDVVLAVTSYGSELGDPNWNPDADLAPIYGRIDIFDLVTCASHYGEKYP